MKLTTFSAVILATASFNAAASDGPYWTDVNGEIVRSYDLGANSYITKPFTLSGFVEVIIGLGQYWFEIVELPPEGADVRRAHVVGHDEKNVGFFLRNRR